MTHLESIASAAPALRPAPSGLVDGGNKPIDLGEVYSIPDLNPQHWRERDGGGVRKYTASLAALVKEATRSNQFLVPFSGKTSSGILQVGRLAEGRDIKGLQMPLLLTEDELLPYLDGAIEFDDGKPSSITLPGGASIDAVNSWLAFNYPGYLVNFDITTNNSSTVAANFLTGGLGDNRQALDVAEITLIQADGSVHTVTDPVEINALRGTQGYAGMVSEIKLKLRDVPKFDEYWMVPLIDEPKDPNAAQGETDASDEDPDVAGLKKSWLGAYPHLAAQLAEFMMNRDPKDIWIDGAELMDRSGCETILRHSGNSSEMGKRALELLSYLDKTGAHGAVMLHFRKPFCGQLLQAGPEDHPRADELLSRVLKLVEEGVIDVDPKWTFNNKTDSKVWTYFREAIPENARGEGALKEHASDSTDRDVVLRVKGGSEILKADNVDEVRAGIRSSIRRAIRPSTDAYSRARTRGYHPTWNGHVSFLERDGITGPFDGGGNIHLRVTGPAEERVDVEAITAGISQELSELHGTGLPLGYWDELDAMTRDEILDMYESQMYYDVHLGEKNYPPVKAKWIAEFVHFASSRKELAARRVAHILAAPAATFNFRAPNFQEILCSNGCTDVWEMANMMSLEVRSTYFPGVVAEAK